MARVALEERPLQTFPCNFSFGTVTFSLRSRDFNKLVYETSSPNVELMLTALTDDHRLISVSIATRFATWSTTLSAACDADLLTQLQQYITMNIQGAYNVWQP